MLLQCQHLVSRKTVASTVLEDHSTVQIPCCKITKKNNYVAMLLMKNKLFSVMALQGQTWLTGMFIMHSFRCLMIYNLLGLFCVSRLSRVCRGQQWDFQPLLLLLPKPHSPPTASLHLLLSIQAVLWQNLPPRLQVSLPPSPLPVQPVS